MTDQFEPGPFESRLLDDGFTSGEFIAIEAEHAGGQQALWIGVRPIWYETGPSRRPMIQITYQKQYNRSDLAGPVWLSPETWDDIVRAVNWRLHRKDPLWVRILSKLKGHPH